MFTGLVQAQGSLVERSAQGRGQRLRFECPFEDLQLGESISVDGACLTVAECTAAGFAVDASSETLARTTLGALQQGSSVNLERALRASDRMGGHMVLGHVDQVVRVSRVEPADPGLRVHVDLAEPLLRLVAEKGSVCLNGVSLTVNAVSATGFEVLLIPHTLEVTNLKRLATGGELNFEADVMARYAARWKT
jgi:riboflavin synthase